MNTYQPPIVAPEGMVWGVRTCDSQMQGYAGFKWPEKGTVKAPTQWWGKKGEEPPDLLLGFNPSVECGAGLHFLKEGQGDWSLLNSDPTAKWLIVYADKKSIVETESKAKAPEVEVAISGTIAEILPNVLMSAPWIAETLKLAASGTDSQLAASRNYSQLAASGDSSQLAASGTYSQLAASGTDSRLAASGNYSKLAASGTDSRLAASGDFSRLAASGNCSQLAASGDSSQLAASGTDSQLAASGNCSQLAASGNCSQLAASGNYSKLAASGTDSRLAASGNCSKLAASGDSSQLAASGDFSRLAASGNFSKLAASGDSSQLAASGNFSKLAASGDSSQLAASGDFSRLAASGNGSAVTASAINCTASAGLEGAICLAWHDGGRVRFAVGYVGEDLEANVTYKVVNGKFVKVEPQ